MVSAVTGIAAAQEADPTLVGWQVPADVISATPELTGDGFGRALVMSADGTTMVIGAPDTRLNSTNGVGRIHIYRRTAGAWVHEQAIDCPPSLLLPDGTAITASFGQFGATVDIDADATTIVVGAWGYATPSDPIFSGRAFVYTYDAVADPPWGIFNEGLGYSLPTATLRPESLDSIDLFGQSVAIDIEGDEGTIVVGRPLAGASNTGSLHVFVGADDTWTEDSVLTAGDFGGPSDQLGTRVDIDDGIIVAGVQNADTPAGSNAGEAYAYLRTKAGWPTIPSQLMRGSSGAANDAFGGSLAMFGQTLVIGVSGHDLDAAGSTVPGCGTVFVYRFSSGAYSQDDQLWGRESFQNDAFGLSVALASEDLLLVGAPGFEGAEINSGAGFSYVRAGPADWEPTRADLWTDLSGESESLGRQCAMALDQRAGVPMAVLASEFPATTGDPPIAFGWTYSDELTPAAGGPALPEGAPATPDAPGSDGAEFEGQSTGGSPSGGGTPSGGLGSGGIPNLTIPLIPIVEGWGVVRGTMIYDLGNRIAGIQSDGINFRNEGAARVITTYPETWDFLGSPDLNGDQSGDLLFLDTESRRLKMMVRDGFTITETVNGEDVAEGVTVAALGDFSGDGTDDIVFKDGQSLTCTFISSFGYNGTATAALPFVEADPKAEAWHFFAADAPIALVDDDENDADDNDGGDSGAELIAHNTASRQTLWIDFGSEDGNDAVRTIASGPGTLHGVGDFDNDGTADLLWRSGSNLYYQFMRDGGTTRQGRWWPFDIDGYRVAALSDVDGNGSPDLFLQGHGGTLVFRLGFTAISPDPESNYTRVKMDVIGRRWFDYSDGTMTGFAKR
ncbi:MAG: hypothetical protein O2819_03945 [Planctomycetota bacterium]|nr:hypothetical protein [Planctomycetota bacterium]MDA1106620.1 hypothetical protein [Planctomycetota bacterium]